MLGISAWLPGDRHTAREFRSSAALATTDGRRRHPVERRFIATLSKPAFSSFLADDCRRLLSAVVEDLVVRRLPSEVRFVPVNPRYKGIPSG